MVCTITILLDLHNCSFDDSREVLKSAWRAARHQRSSRVTFSCSTSRTFFCFCSVAFGLTQNYYRKTYYVILQYSSRIFSSRVLKSLFPQGPSRVHLLLGSYDIMMVAYITLVVTNNSIILHLLICPYLAKYWLKS